MNDNKGAATVLAWDGPTRLFKWLLVFVVADAWISQKFVVTLPRWHVWNGYAALILVVFRILWGFWGASTARFSHFLKGPKAALAYIRASFSPSPHHYLGHNPLGAYMVAALLAVVLAMGLTGLFNADPDEMFISGPLVDTVTQASVKFAGRWHERLFNLLMALVCLHVAAALFYQFVRKENLIGAIILGDKPQLPYEDEPRAVLVSPIRAIVCLLAAAAIVLGGVYGAAGKI